MFSRHPVRSLPELLSALLLIQLSWAASPDDIVIKLTATQIKTAGITLTRPAAVNKQSTTGNTLRLSGRVTIPNQSVQVVSATVSGQLQAVLVNVGESVRAGHALARIYSADWVSRQREYLHAAAEADMTRQKLLRDEALYKDGIIALARLEETRTVHGKAQAALREQQQLLKLAGMSTAQIDKLRDAEAIDPMLTIAAPIAGVVLEQSVTPGTRVEPGAPLFKLANTTVLWVELQAAQGQIDQLRIGDGATTVACGQRGKLVAISPQVDASSQTALVRAEFNNAGTCLRPNQYLEVDVHAQASADALAIPVSALVRSGGKDHVFIQTKDGFKLQPVTVQSRQHEQAWVKNTLGADVQIAVSGIAALRGAAAGLGMEE